MINIVTGYMRTGTSMMMRALEAGGLEVAKSAERDLLAKVNSDENYNGNPYGLYELTIDQMKEDNFPNQYEGKLIKVLGPQAFTLSPTKGMRVVLMRRDKEEIRQSFDAFFGKQLPVENVDERMEVLERILNNRKDVLSVDVFWYREVIENPRKHFEILKDKGWEIDIDKCVNAVEPELCRFKRENLEIGIK